MPAVLSYIKRNTSIPTDVEGLEQVGVLIRLIDIFGSLVEHAEDYGGPRQFVDGAGCMPHGAWTSQDSGHCLIVQDPMTREEKTEMKNVKKYVV